MFYAVNMLVPSSMPLSNHSLNIPHASDIRQLAIFTGEGLAFSLLITYYTLLLSRSTFGEVPADYWWLETSPLRKMAHTATACDMVDATTEESFIPKTNTQKCKQQPSLSSPYDT